MTQKILETLKHVANQNKLKIDFNDSTITLKDLGIDSLALLNLIFSVENELNVRLPDAELINIKNLGDLIKAFEQACSKQ